MKIPFTSLEVKVNGYTQNIEIRNSKVIRIETYDPKKHGIQEDYSNLKAEPKWKDL